MCPRLLCQRELSLFSVPARTSSRCSFSDNRQCDCASIRTPNATPYCRIQIPTVWLPSRPVVRAKFDQPLVCSARRSESCG